MWFERYQIPYLPFQYYSTVLGTMFRRSASCGGIRYLGSITNKNLQWAFPNSNLSAFSGKKNQHPNAPSPQCATPTCNKDLLCASLHSNLSAWSGKKQISNSNLQKAFVLRKRFLCDKGIRYLACPSYGIHEWLTTCSLRSALHGGIRYPARPVVPKARAVVSCRSQIPAFKKIFIYESDYMSLRALRPLRDIKLADVGEYVIWEVSDTLFTLPILFYSVRHYGPLICLVWRYPIPGIHNQ